MIDKIIENLYVGEANDILDERRIEQFNKLQITHILTVSTRCIPVKQMIDEIYYLFVYAVDMETQDMFADNLLDKSLKFISTNIENGGRVFVHCECGISRSIFVIAAYLMQKFHWKSSKAVKYIQTIRPIAQPNDGFLQQLRIFESADFVADFQIVSQCPLYKEWLVKSCSSVGVVPGSSTAFALDEKPAEKLNPTNVEYRCRKCRKTLFYDHHIMTHKTDGNEAVDCGFSYFLLPMEWMSLQEYEGKILCPSCSEKLGRYIWGGRVCNGVSGKRCGTAVRPWIYVNQNKIDRISKASRKKVVQTVSSIQSPP